MMPTKSVAKGLFVALVLCLLAAAFFVGLLSYGELRALRAPQEDSGWAILQLGLEHERLRFAAATGESEKDVKLRGEIFLSRVKLVRDSPIFAEVRASALKEKLGQLFGIARETEALIDGLTPATRVQFQERLDADAGFIRQLTLDMSSLNRSLLADARKRRTMLLYNYFIVLELVVFSVLALAVFALRTNRKVISMSEDLQRQSATNHAILSSVDDAIVGIGAERRVLYSNPKAAELLGEWLRTGVLPSVAEAGHTALTAGIIALMDQQQPAASPSGLTGHSKVSSLFKGLKRVYDLKLYRPPQGATGLSDSSVVITITDITDAEEAAEKREVYDARIADVSRLMSYAVISGGIVHEISQPLAAIKNHLHTLKVATATEQARERRAAIVDSLAEEVDRAIQVVRNVRQLEVGDPEEAGVCALDEAIGHAIRLVSIGQKPPPDIKVISDGKGAVAAASLPLVSQVVVNLLNNALSASASSGRRGAEISVDAKGEEAEISVADFGSGVSPDVAARLFTPFTKSAHGGMGLGLAISRRIVDNVGGSISWRNRETGGAVFTIRIPLAHKEKS